MSPLSSPISWLLASVIVVASIAFLADAMVSINLTWTCGMGADPNGHHLETLLNTGSRNMANTSPAVPSPLRRPATAMMATLPSGTLAEGSRSIATMDMWAPYRATGLKITLSMEIDPDKLGGPKAEWAAASPKAKPQSVCGSSNQPRTPTTQKGEAAAAGGRRHKRADSEGAGGRWGFGRGRGSGGGGSGESASGRGGRGFFADRLFRRSRTVSDDLDEQRDVKADNGERKTSDAGDDHVVVSKTMSDDLGERLDVKADSGENKTSAAGDDDRVDCNLEPAGGKPSTGKIDSDNGGGGNGSGHVEPNRGSHRTRTPLTVQVEEDPLSLRIWGGEDDMERPGYLGVSHRSAGTASCPQRAAGSSFCKKTESDAIGEEEVKRIAVGSWL